ncbi:hypothetical protein D7B24_002247 [Verticillium nonalfalfae]|uniref:Uncharacterized protein n=1 Tax=Verticillium nonalfalfae TaxID=1051616 RepID=A0A3M9XYZ2_9PEZI|nr:uncharacterized protein D7B24_002247 [Verticillium nonalfalfae]RNJ53204.1 hypothetical protein D7B24_002247 [Verticillium nonalfalfae]
MPGNRTSSSSMWWLSSGEIKRARARVEKEAFAIRNATEDIVTPANAFETHAGQFWQVYSTRAYMRARFELAGPCLLATGTLDGVQQALEHLLDMLKLSRSDNMGLRDIIPAIMLRLDLDRECHDFIRWWSVLDSPGDDLWADSDAPYLIPSEASILSEPDFISERFPSLDHLNVLLLLELRLVVDIRNLKVCRKVLAASKLPEHLWRTIELATLRSPLSSLYQQLPPDDLTTAGEVHLEHAKKLGSQLHRANSSFMFDLFDPDEALSSVVETYSLGSWEEMALTLQNSYAAWSGSEGVLDLLGDACLCAELDSEAEMEDMMDTDTFQSGEGRDRTIEELLEDVGVNRLWGYLEDAYADAYWLGPWCDRPSEQRRKEARRLWDEPDDDYFGYGMEDSDLEDSDLEDGDLEDGDFED